MSTFLQNNGWFVALLCEKQPHLANLLAEKFPDADIQADVLKRPWEKWALDGFTVLLTVAGIACQPFSGKGLQLFQHDSRSKQSLLVCDAALALKSKYILLENIHNFVDLDCQHGVFSATISYYKEHGFILRKVHKSGLHQPFATPTKPMRKQVFILFQHITALTPHLDRMVGINYPEGPPVPQTDSKPIFFFHETDEATGFLSNWFYSPFFDPQSGSLFPTVETYIMYHKAILFDDPVSAALILAASTPKEAKALGRMTALNTFSEPVWAAHRGRIAEVGCWLKFSSDPMLSHRLTNTAPCPLAEASPHDAIWGIGISVQQAESGLAPRGENILGLALATVRTLLLSRDANPFSFVKGCSGRNWMAYAVRVPISEDDKLPPDTPMPRFHLQFGSSTICPGSVVHVPGTPGKWRVQSIEGAILDLRTTTFTSTSTLREHASRVQHLVCPESRYPVYSPHALPPHFTAWGEPPGRGAPLVEVSCGFVATMSPEDRWNLQSTDISCSTSDFQRLNALGCSDEQLNSAIGNSTSEVGLFPLLMALTMETQDIVSPVLEDASASEPSPPGTTRIICLFVDPFSMTIHIPVAGYFSVDVPSSECTTGNVIKHVQPAFRGSLLIYGGDALLHGEAVKLVCCVSAPSEPTSSFSLKQLAEHELYSAASLAMAKLSANSSGYTTRAQLLSILTGASGKLPARPMAHLDILEKGCTLSREQALELCHSREDSLRAAYIRRASELDSPVSAYLLEWSLRVSFTTLDDVPGSLLSSIPVISDPALASLPYSNMFQLPATPEPPAPRNDTCLTNPASTQDLYETWAWQRIQDHVMLLTSYFKAVWDHYEQHRHIADWHTIDLSGLSAIRPSPLVLGLDALKPEFRGVIWDCRKGVPTPLDLSRQTASMLNKEVWSQYMSHTEDRQLFYFANNGAMSLVDLPHRTVYQSPLLSLCHGIESISDEILRLQQAGYVGITKHQPFVPFLTWPNGCVAKKGSRIMRRISDAGAGGPPQTFRLDSEGLMLQSFNEAIRASDTLPKEIKAMPSDLMRDTCVQRYIADLLGWTVTQASDDLKDWFYQLVLHLIELFKTNFLMMLKGDDTMSFVNEKVMGMGYVHTSNIAQRLANSVVQIFLRKFAEVDAPFLAAESKQFPILKAYLEHRSRLPQSAHCISEARLITMHAYTDDFIWSAITPLDQSRAVRATEVWKSVCDSLGLITAEARKRQTGCTVEYTGVISNAVLGLSVIPQAKTMKCLAGLALCISGRQTFDPYRKMFGLISYVRYVLNLPASTVSAVKQPLRGEHEAGLGGACTIRVTNGRVKQWVAWADRMVSAHGAPITRSIRLALDLPFELDMRMFVWHGDAAILGTNFPALAGYAQGLYWVLPLSTRQLEILQKYITVLELLVVLGNFMVFGPLLHGDHFRVLLQSDSLVSCYVLSSAASADLLVSVHNYMLAQPEVQRLADKTDVGQVYGEGNTLTDNLSRGEMDLFFRNCVQLGVKPIRLDVPAAFIQILDAIATEALEPQ
jgi:hypothetical protein